MQEAEAFGDDMDKQQKKRLCWNCEGNILMDQEICPFCGVSVVPAVLDQGNHSFAPAYQMSHHTSNSAVPKSPYISEPIEQEPKETKSVYNERETGLDEFKFTFLSTLLLLSGAVFALFGAVLFFFSKNGIFRLEWDANFWFFYLILSLPMLYLGWKILHKIKE